MSSDQLRAPESNADWEAYHRIRETVLWEARGRFGVYDRGHPDEHVAGNHPLLLEHDATLMRSNVAEDAIGFCEREGWRRVEGLTMEKQP